MKKYSILDQFLCRFVVKVYLFFYFHPKQQQKILFIEYFYLYTYYTEKNNLMIIYLKVFFSKIEYITQEVSFFSIPNISLGKRNVLFWKTDRETEREREK